MTGGTGIARRTSTLAILSLVAAFVLSWLGVILGIVALVRIRSTGEAGRGFAIAAIIVGILVTAYFVLAFGLPYLPFLLNALAAAQES